MCSASRPATSSGVTLSPLPAKADAADTNAASSSVAASPSTSAAARGAAATAARTTPASQRATAASTTSTTRRTPRAAQPRQYRATRPDMIKERSNNAYWCFCELHKCWPFCSIKNRHPYLCLLKKPGCAVAWFIFFAIVAGVVCAAVLRRTFTLPVCIFVA